MVERGGVRTELISSSGKPSATVRTNLRRSDRIESPIGAIGHLRSAEARVVVMADNQLGDPSDFAEYLVTIALDDLATLADMSEIRAARLLGRSDHA